MKRAITIEVEEDELQRYATFSVEAVQYYNPALQAVIAEAKKLYPQYEVGQWYKVVFDTRPDETQMLYRNKGGWVFTEGDRYNDYTDSVSKVLKAVKMVEAGD